LHSTVELNVLKTNRSVSSFTSRVMYRCHATPALLVGFMDSIHTSGLVVVASHHQHQQQQ